MSRGVETSREIRLWFGQIVSIVGVVMLLVPEARELAVEKVRNISKNLRKKRIRIVTEDEEA